MRREHVQARRAELEKSEMHVAALEEARTALQAEQVERARRVNASSQRAHRAAAGEPLGPVHDVI